MEKVMTNGFCELNEQEMMETEGGNVILTLVVGGAIAYAGVHIVGNIALGIQNKYLEAKDAAFTKHCNDVLNQNVMLTR